MSFTPLLATKEEVMALNVDVSASSVGLTAEKFSMIFDVLHEGVEARILDYIARPTLDAAALALNRTMKAALKLATIQVMANLFIWWKQSKLGRIIKVDDSIAMIQDPKVFTAELKDLLKPYRSRFAYMGGSYVDDNRELVVLRDSPAISYGSDIDSIVSELIADAENRDFSDTPDWTGAGWSLSGGTWAHVAGANATTLANTELAAEPFSGHIYKLLATVITTTAGTLTPSFGSTAGAAVGQTAGTLTQQQWIIVASGSGALTFTPDSTWEGSIDDISLTELVERAG